MTWKAHECPTRNVQDNNNDRGDTVLVLIGLDYDNDDLDCSS